jgi:type II secretory pathway pseudopilin PulG
MTRRARGEGGETLVELLATIVIMGTAVIAVVAGIGVAITSSDANAKQVTALTVIRNYAEAIQAAPYAPCGTAASYAPGAVGFTPPANFTVSIVGAVTYYDGTSSPAVFSASCPPPDKGAQRMTIKAHSSDNRADRSLEIVKRGP